MQLNPRYGSTPIVSLDGPPDAIAEPAMEQRRRLGKVLATLDDEQWSQSSRCEGWSVRDVIVHLESTNTFWSYSIAMGLKGEPSRVLADFDPVASPAAFVAEMPPISSADLARRFTESSEALCGLIESLSGDQWSVLAEAPIGHVKVNTVVHHALWDSWVHERDVLLPLGVTPAEKSDEVSAVLRYAAALSPAFALMNGAAHVGRMGVSVNAPAVSFTVEVGDSVEVFDGVGSEDQLITGNAVQLAEALSLRAPFDPALPPEWQWITEGLTETFDAS